MPPQNTNNKKIYLLLFIVTLMSAVVYFHFFYKGSLIDSTNSVTFINKDDFSSKIKSGRYDLNRKNSEGKTPLMAAALKCRSDLVDILVDAGADVNISGEYGKTAIIYGAMCSVNSISDSVSIIKKLLSHGANPNTIVKSENLSAPANDPGTSLLTTLATLRQNEEAIAEVIRAGGKDSRDGVFMKPSEYSAVNDEKISYDVLVGATSPEILELKSKTSGVKYVWSDTSGRIRKYSGALDYCKSKGSNYRLPTKTELQISFINNESDFRSALYYSSDLGDNTYWNAQPIDGINYTWEKVSNGNNSCQGDSCERTLVNMYNGISYTSGYLAYARCIKE